jgi:16S rRNA G966 N2-methylase RsmD
MSTSYIHHNDVLYTFITNRPYKVQSALNLNTCRPASPYLLGMNAFVQTLPTLLMVGLGGGTLSTSRALNGRSTHVVEIDSDVIRAYETVIPAIARYHCGINDVSMYTTVVHADATNRTNLTLSLPRVNLFEYVFLDYAPCLSFGQCMPAMKALAAWLQSGALVYMNLLSNFSYLNVPRGWRHLDTRRIGQQYVGIVSTN